MRDTAFNEVFGITSEGRSVTAQSRYEALSQDRDTYLTRARECGKLTLPALIPPEGSSGGNKPNEKLKTPFQGVGAKGVNTLAAKFLMALFPPNTPMFRLNLLDFNKELEAATVDKGWKTEIEKGLSKYEQAVQREIEASGDRPVIHEMFLHLLVAGNILLYDGDTSPVRCFILPHYAVKRDPSGNVLEILTLEEISPSVLPEDVVQAIEANQDENQSGQDRSDPNRLWRLYTHVKRHRDLWYSYQECGGVIVEGSEGSYPLDGCPWIPLRMYNVAGEDYGRSYVENYLGDLKSLEGLSQALLEGASISSKVVFLVNPTGSTHARDLEKAPNGGFVAGDPNDVVALQVGKAPDLRVAFEEKQDITRRLAEAFLLMDGIRRDAERVTAEEIRAVAQELEATLSGGYSILSQEFQLPYIKRKIHKLRRAGKLPELPKDAVEPLVTTGFEALGRGNDKNKLLSFLTTLSEAIGQDNVQRFVNLSNFITRLATADGINTDGLIRTEEELASLEAQTAETAQTNDLIGKLGPETIKALSTAAQQPQEA